MKTKRLTAQEMLDKEIPQYFYINGSILTGTALLLGIFIGGYILAGVFFHAKQYAQTSVGNTVQIFTSK